VERLIIWAEGASGVVDTRWPSSPRSMAGSLWRRCQIVLRLKVRGARVEEGVLV